MLIESLRRNWPLLHSPSFLPLFVTSHGSLPRALSPLYLWRILMKLRDALNFSIGTVFVIISAGFFFVLIFTKSFTLLSTTHWRILWYLTSMCFVRLWYLWSLARWITLWLSQWTRTESCIMLNVSTNPLNHKTFFDNSTAAMYSVSVVEKVAVSCNFAFQLMTYSATVST